MKRAALVVVLVACTKATAPNATAVPPARLTLEQLAGAPVIVSALVVKASTREGHHYATAERMQTLRGEASETFELLDDGHDLRVGEHDLMFLTAAPHAVIGGGHGAIKLIHDSRGPDPHFVARPDAGSLALPDDLCSGKYCYPSADALLERLRLPALKTMPHTPWFRRSSVTCQHCDLAPRLDGAIPSDAVDCGTGDIDACARAALQKRQPFVARQLLNQYTQLTRVWIFDGSQMRLLQHLDLLEAGACGNHVQAQDCSATWPPDCPTPYRMVCDEDATRVETLSPPAPLETLDCKTESPTLSHCHRAAEPGPPTDGGRDLICRDSDDECRPIF